MDKSLFLNEDSASTTFSTGSYQVTPISSPRGILQNREEKIVNGSDRIIRLNQYGGPPSSRGAISSRTPTAINGRVTNTKQQQIFNRSPRARKSTSFPFSIDPMGATGATERRNAYKKTSSGNLTAKLVMSGISRLAVPPVKNKDETKEFPFGNVLVLHLQCKNINVLTLGALDPFFGLKNLYLYKNNIRRIQGLDNLHNLDLLDLSRNNVERIDNLQNCTKLKKLYLGFNEIQVVEGLENLKTLEELQVDDQDIPPEQPLIFSPGIMASLSGSLILLDISSNQLSSLAPIANLHTLDTLNAAHNCLNDITEVLGVLQTLHQLRILSLKGNPIAKKPTYKSNVIGAVFRLEVLDDKDIHDTTRVCVQKLKHWRELRTRKSKEQANLQANRMNNQSRDCVNLPDFHFATPTRLSPSPFPPPPKPFKLTTRKSLSASMVGAAKKTSTMNIENPNFVRSMSSYPAPPHRTSSMAENSDSSSVYECKARSIQASEFKDDFNLDHDDEGMSDMAKIIFRLSNLDEVGGTFTSHHHDHDGSGDAKVHPSNYWDLPGSSMIRECRPISPLEGLDLAISPPLLPSSMSSPELLDGENRVAAAEIRSNTISSRPKPAAPGGRRSSHNANNSLATTTSAPNFTHLAEDLFSSSSSQQQNQLPYCYGRTLSPLIELPTPESLTARDEIN